ncbi:BLUF domain-containing protein [Psychrobacter fulvigenes]|nr:BLUF domain-containing protein [Psychrobacter fulvigenes]
MAQSNSDAHILVSMTYASRANPDVSAKDFNEILQQAQKNNAANGITGMLVFNKNYFLQTIEGPRAQINRLL